MIKGKTALVTGASRGIGRAIALELAAQGMNVAVVYAGNTAAAQDTVGQLRQLNVQAQAYACDVADFEACGSMFQEVIKTYGRMDVLVNNAGIVKDGLLMAMKEADFSKVVDVNLKGTFHCIHHAARQMIRQRNGRIVNMASVVGIQGNAGQANYAASKAGIIGLTKAAARELAGRGITVNAVAPGFIETDMTAALSEKVREGAKGLIPLGTFGKPEDVAEAAAFFASEKTGYITGQVLCVDGGMAM